MSFIDELKRRNIFRVAIAYIVTCWLIVQVADVVIDNIGAPDWLFRTILMLLAIGFPLVLIFTWAFELTPDGIRREADVDRSGSVTPQTGRKLDLVIIGLLAVALVYFIWESRFAADGADVPGTPQMAVDSPDESPVELDKSIAVLPFTTRSSDEDDRFFSDGIHDDLLTQLAKIGDLKVISRTSVMEYRDTLKNLKQVGAELGVATVLEGAFQRSGNQVRINVQLIDAKTDQHLWAENYDRELTANNLFAMQTEIAKAIATALHATLSPEERQRLEQNTLTENLQALRAYQRARFLNANAATEDNLLRAEAELKQALELDPGFAAAWALLARVNMALLWHADNDDVPRVAAAREAIDRGRQIAPELADLDIAEGYYHYWGFLDYANAIRILAPVAKDYPNNAEVHLVLGFVYRRQGNFDEALERLHQSLTIDPRSIRASSTLAETYLLLGNADKAREYLELAGAIGLASPLYSMMAGFIAWELDQDPVAAGRHWRNIGDAATFELWKSEIARGNYDLSQDFSVFNDYSGTAGVRFLPSLMRGLTLKFSGDQAAAMPFLSQAIDEYEVLLADSPQQFQYLKPLCWAHGAHGTAADAQRVCNAALANLPYDQFDFNFQRVDIAGGFAMAGLHEQALDLIEQVLSDRARPRQGEFLLTPFLRDLHDEQRWQRLVKTTAATR